MFFNCAFIHLRIYISPTVPVANLAVFFLVLVELSVSHRSFVLICLCFCLQVKAEEKNADAKRLYEHLNAELHDLLPALFDSRIVSYGSMLQVRRR